MHLRMSPLPLLAANAGLSSKRPSFDVDHDHTGSLQLLVYPDHPSSFQLVDRKPDQAARLRAYRVFDRLAKQDFANLGADVEEYCKQPYFRFDQEAQEAFNGWWTRLETTKIPGEAADIMKEHLSKYRSLLPSLALLIFLVEQADKQDASSSTPSRIPLRAVTQAIGWCEYLEKHARRVYGLGRDFRIQAAIALARKIRRGDVKDGFSTRDVYRNGWSGLSDPEVVGLACAELEAAGWLRMQRPRKTGGRPAARTYEINPRLRPGPADDGAARAAEAGTPKPRGHLKAVK
jgi:hypothetical protein